MWKLQEYKDRWDDEPGETHRERSARESAVNSVEQALKDKGTEFVEDERRAIAKVGDGIAQSTANIESAAKAMIKELRTRLVDVEKMADQVVALKRQAARNRAGIAELTPRQEANEKRAENVVGYMENFYEKFPAMRNPAEDLPPFRTDLERARAVYDDQEKRRVPNRPTAAQREKGKRIRKKLF